MEDAGKRVSKQAAAEGGSRLPYGFSAWLHAIVRRFEFVSRRRVERHTELLETLNLGGKRQLLLVQCDGRRFLLGAGSDSIQAIVELGPRKAGERLPVSDERDLPVAADVLFNGIDATATVGRSQ
jgi:flagellar biogenesis protein FliO